MQDLIGLGLFFLTFISLNILFYGYLYKIDKRPIVKNSLRMWISLLVTIALEAISPQTPLWISLVFIINFLPISFLSRILLDKYHQTLNYVRYAQLGVLSLIWAVIANGLGLSFQVMCMPIVLVTSFPILEGLKYFYKNRNEANNFEKIIGYVVFPFGFINCLTYGLFRIYPEAIYVGFASAFVAYLAAAICMPLMIVYDLMMDKQVTLERQVSQQTALYKDSNVEKEKLIRILAHDISNALQGIYLSIAKVERINTSYALDVADRLYSDANKIKDITNNVRKIESVRKQKYDFNRVSVINCIDELIDAFVDLYETKSIKLKFKSDIADNVYINVDKIIFIHSVLGNVLSNSLKFSHPQSEVIIRVRKSASKVYIEIEDFGIGLNGVNIANIDFDKIPSSQLGTRGEIGSGIGLSLVKEYVSLFKGNYVLIDKNKTGTITQITLPLST